MELRTEKEEVRNFVRRPGGVRGFSLVELLTVVAIIGLLVAILIPALGSARDSAKAADTRALLGAIEGGLEVFKASTSIGGAYPPSASDNPDHFTTANPFATSGTMSPTSGANLVVYALFGADLLGTPGFPDANGNGWWDDLNGGIVAPPNPPAGAYTLDGNRTPRLPRYGPFCDDTVTSKIASVTELVERGTVRSHSLGAGASLPVFVDTFGHPVLYYRARRAAGRILTDPSGSLGVYDHRDNAAFTGSREAGTASARFTLQEHQIFAATKGGAYYPGPNATPTECTNNDWIGCSTYDNTFVRFIWDRTVTARNTPVNRESFLVISAGPDGIYGSHDDITNWKP